MEPTLYVMTDAVIVKAIAENLLVILDERAVWIEDYISQSIVPWEHDMYLDSVFKRVAKLGQVEVD